MMRVWLSLLISLVLGLSSVTMAVARSQAAPAGQITLCSGYGTVTVAVDAEGNPAGPMHPCPDCLSGLIFAPSPEAIVLTARPAVAGDRMRIPATPDLPALATITPVARGPPLSI